MVSTFSDEYQRVIAALISARKSNDVRQEDVAAALEKPQSFVSKVEHNVRRIDVVEFVHYCNAIGVDPITIMREADLITDES